MTPKPTIPEVVEKFVAYKRVHPAWGCLHVVLDDGNVDDGFVVHCIEYARETSDAEGEQLGQILLQMSKTQRRKLAQVAARAQTDQH